MSIRLEHLYAGYGTNVVLHDVNLELPDEGTRALIGPSGSGKTTLLKVLSGLLAPMKGTIIGLDGKKVSMVFQEDRLLPWCTALENVTAVSTPECAEYWLCQLELRDALQAYPNALSGGMQRRVALARACAYQGDVLLLDEPFKGLDDALKKRIVPSIRKAASLIVIVTHDPEEAELLEAVPLHLFDDNA